MVNPGLTRITLAMRMRHSTDIAKGAPARRVCSRRLNPLEHTYHTIGLFPEVLSWYKTVLPSQDCALLRLIWDYPQMKTMLCRHSRYIFVKNRIRQPGQKDLYSVIIGMFSEIVCPAAGEKGGTYRASYWKLNQNGEPLVFLTSSSALFPGPCAGFLPRPEARTGSRVSPACRA